MINHGGRCISASLERTLQIAHFALSKFASRYHTGDGSDYIQHSGSRK